jgi:spermidine/putrescine transport system substrate-binding protein
MADNEIRILVDPRTAERVARGLTRRGFLGVGLGAASMAFLAACGSSGGSGSSATTAGATPTTAGSATTTGGSTGATTTAATTATTAAGAPSRVLDAKAKSFNLYTWADYDDPDLLSTFGNITIDVFNSNEDAIAKLESSGGTSGYDMICPTGTYIPQMASKGLLEALDLSLVTSFKNIDPPYTNQLWDPGNKYSVCKDWGSTGYIWDTKVVKDDIVTWADFIKAAQTTASGKTSVLDAAGDVTGIYFWANGINWTTEKKEDLDACEQFLVNEFASHIKAFDSYPGINLTQGNYALSQVWNGDARQGLVKVADSGGDPSQYKWALGAPKTELWMDTWCILKGAKNLDAAYNFINFILTPENSVKDLEFHGYNTGLKGVREIVPDDLTYPEMIFFDDAQVSKMEAGAVNTAQQRLVDILDKVKAKAGG